MGGLHALHHVGRPDADRLGRLPGLLARGAADDRRGGRGVPEPRRRHALAPSRPSARWRSSGPSAPTSRWRSTTWCRARRRTSWPAKGWSGRCGGWSGAGRGTHELTGSGPGPAAHSLQTLWPIVQGGTHQPTSGERRSEGTLERGPWTGIAIGGLSVGEPKPVMHRVLEELEPVLPRECPVILWGSGFPPDLLEGIARGVDLFDCVAATRNGRHGTRLAADGPGQRAGRGAQADRRSRSTRSAIARPARPSPRGYLRHLFVARTCSASGWCRFTTSGSWSGWASRRGRTSWTEPSSGWSREWLRRYYTRGEREAALLLMAPGHPGRAAGLHHPGAADRRRSALVFYFLILRPQSQARKKHAELLSQLKKGDEVMTERRD